jgi:hypothetical protein
MVSVAVKVPAAVGLKVKFMMQEALAAREPVQPEAPLNRAALTPVSTAWREASGVDPVLVKVTV